MSLSYRSPDTSTAPAKGRRSPSWLPAACVAALSIAGAIAYGGSAAAAEIAYRLIVEGALVVYWLASAAGWGSWFAAWLLRPPASPQNDIVDSRAGQTLAGVVTAIAIGLGLIGLTVLGLGLAGLMSQLVAFGLLGAGVGCGIGWLAFGKATTLRVSATVADGSSDIAGNRRWNWLWLAAVPMASLVLAAAYVPPGLLWKPSEPHGYDVVEYHFQVPREWYDAGRIQPLDHNAFSYFPFGVEMHDLLAFYVGGGPWAGMYLAQLMHVAFMVLAVLATFAFAMRFAMNRGLAVAASVLVATVPLIGQLAPIGFNEGGLLLYATLAVGWSVDWLRWQLGSTNPAGRTKRRLVLAGLCVGFACGVKLTAVPMLLVVIPIVLVATIALRQRTALTAACVSAVTFVAIGLLAFSPWLVRNLVWTGNPLFPEGRAVFGDEPFTSVQADRWTAAHAPRADQRAVGARLSALVDQVLINRQFGFALLPFGVVALIFNRRSPIAWYLAGLLAIQLVFWLGFTHLQGRFLVFAIPIAAIAIAAVPVSTTSRSARRALTLTVALGVITLAMVNWHLLHQPLWHKLRQEQGTGIAVALGKQDMTWITAGSLEGFPLSDPEARLVLVGDAQAFWYPLDASRLYYRTVFDLRSLPGVSLLDAFDPLGWRRDGKTWLLVTPSELKRYEETYRSLPPIPDRWKRMPGWESGQSLLVPPADLPRWETLP